MFLVDDAIIEALMSQTPTKYVKLRAQLSPGMQVVDIHGYEPVIHRTADLKVRQAAAAINGTKVNTDLEEDYQLNTEATHVVSLEDGYVVVYYHYDLIKEEDD